MALKFLRRKVRRNSLLAELMRAELRALATLEHPGIVAAFDHGHVSPDAVRSIGLGLVAGSPWFAMEVVEGWSLRSRRCRIDWEELGPLTLEILDALAHAHGRGVVHRDLKPANVLVDRGRDGRSRARLTDFGLAWFPRERELDEMGRKLQGTPGYLAPEQALGEPARIGPWTDLYAVGATVWSMLHGAAPHDHEDRTASLHATVTADLPPWRPVAPVPPWLQAWTAMCLERQPRDRFGSAALAAEAFRQLDRGSISVAVSDLRSARPVPERRWPARHVSAGSALAPSLRLLPFRDPPVVGRQREQQELWDRLRAVRAAGRPAVVLLSGAAGLGKSRLASWLSEQAEIAGVARSVTAYPGARVGLGPLLARVLLADEDRPDDALVQVQDRLAARGVVEPWLAAAVAELASPSRAPSTSEATLAWEARVETALRVLRAESAVDPLLIWLEDGHTNLEAIQLGMRLLDDDADVGPVLLMLCVATDRLEPGSVEAGLVDDLRTAGAFDLELHPLSDEATGALLSGAAPLTREAAASLAGEARGNPLLALQLLADRAEAGALRGESGRLALHPGFEAPVGLAGLWHRRLQRTLQPLGEHAAECVELAAVLGVEVELREWRDVCLAHGVELPSGLVAGLGQAGLAELRLGGFRFTHELARDAVLEEARRAGRLQRLHATCAEVLADAGAPDERLAVHLQGAGREAEAGDRFVGAARQLLGVGDLDTAERLLTKFAALGLEGPLAYAAEGLELAVQRLRYGGPAIESEVRDYAERAPDRDDVAAARAWLLLAAVLRDGGNIAEAVGAVERAEEHARLAPSLRPEISLALGRLTQVAGRPQEALALFEVAGPEATLPRAGVLCDLGRFDEAERLLESFESQLLEQGRLGVLAATLIARARIHAQGRQEWAASEQLLRRALSLHGALGHGAGLASTWNGLGEMLRLQGRLVDARAAYEESSAAFGRLGARGRAAPELNLATVDIAEGQARSAVQRLLALRTELSGAGARGLQASVEAVLVAAYARLEDRAGLGDAVERLARYLDGGVTPQADVAEHLEAASEASVRHGWLKLGARCANLASLCWSRLGEEARAEMANLRAQRLLVDRSTAVD